jgi:hypothetical protein
MSYLYCFKSQRTGSYIMCESKIGLHGCFFPLPPLKSSSSESRSVVRHKHKSETVASIGRCYSELPS